MAWSIFKQGGGPLVAKGWAEQFLTKLGAPVTPGNVQFVYQWELAEGGGGKFNPLNQGPVKGHPELTTTGSQFGGGAADFASWEAGLQGAYDYLHYGHYKGVLAGLMNNDPVSARNALIASPWAASHYDYGRHWPVNATAPGGAAVLPSTISGLGNVTPAGLNITTVADKNCAWKLALPAMPDACVISKGALRGIIGVGLMVGGTVVGLVGVVVLIVYGLGQSGAGSAVVSAIPGGSVVQKFAR